MQIGQAINLRCMETQWYSMFQVCNRHDDVITWEALVADDVAQQLQGAHIEGGPWGDQLQLLPNLQQVNRR